MKKLFSIILAMVMAASLFTGCVEKNDPENKVEPTPTPAATPGPVTDVDEDDPNYPTVLAMWKDMDGYWVRLVCLFQLLLIVMDSQLKWEWEKFIEREVVLNQENSWYIKWMVLDLKEEKNFHMDLFKMQYHLVY